MAKTVQVLVVAGGGSAGGNQYAGGGGAGGLLEKDAHEINPGIYPVVVGLGGAQSAANSNGNKGGDSSFDNIIANGGGAGKSYKYSQNQQGGQGGCGAGGCSNTGLAGVADQGNVNGATGYGYNGGAASASYGAGGGGAGGVGGTPNVYSKGLGRSNSITGTSVTYSAGGKGTAGIDSGSAGASNTGNGGDAAGNVNYGYAGGSGIVVIKYLTADFGTCTGGVVSTDGDYTIHKFIESGNFVCKYSQSINFLKDRRRSRIDLSPISLG